MGLMVRTLLIWALVLAVPAQAVAAVTMAFCGPGHHAGAPADHAQSAGDVQVAHHEHGNAAHADVDADADTAAVPDKLHPAAKQKCSACASCCSAGAILSTVLTVPAPAATPTVFSAVVPSVDTFAADGPDRPPRIALA